MIDRYIPENLQQNLQQNIFYNYRLDRDTMISKQIIIMKIKYIH